MFATQAVHLYIYSKNNYYIRVYIYICTQFSTYIIKIGTVSLTCTHSYLHIYQIIRYSSFHELSPKL